MNGQTPAGEGADRPAAAPTFTLVADRRAADLWWLNPLYIVLLGVLPIYLAVMLFDFRRVVANVYVPSGLYAFGALLILTLAVGIQLARCGPADGPRCAPPCISRGLMMVLLLPMLAAYALWFGPLMLQPQLLAEIVSGQRAELRQSLSTLPGLTTLTQLGVAYVIAYALKSGAGVQPISRIERVGLGLVFVLAAFRAFAWAERLAVTELIVCWTVTRMAYLPISRPSHWRVAKLVPAVAPFALYLIFTASEYFRSWEYYTRQYDSVWQFTLDRLLAYYATAINNGIGVLVDTTGWPHYSGAFILESLYRMPGLGTLLQNTFDDPRSVPLDWIEVYARPEFNSPTDYFRIVLDLGFAGAVLYYLVLGYVVGRAYQGFRQGRGFGLLAYGVLVLQLLESLRYGYLGESRFMPLLLGLLLVAADMHRQRERAVNAAWQSQRTQPASP